MEFEVAFVLLFSVATAVALVARWLRVPYTVALVMAGLGLGAAHAFEPPHLTKELLYAVFLPGLLFEAAFHLDFRKFLQNKLAIFSLAVPGVVAAIVLTAVVLTPAASALHFVDGFGIQAGLVFAALIAATDPIAVVALFKSLGAPKRLAVIVEGESLLNDGTAVVLFTLVLAAVSGGDITIGTAAVRFFAVVGMGLLIGAIFGLLASKVTEQVEDPMIEITLTTIAAYGSFVTAEQFHFSGVIATVTAGMLCGNYGARVGMSPSTRIAVESFWEYFAFALNSIVFLLIGFEVGVESLIASALPIAVGFVAVLVARGSVVGVVTLALRRSRERIPGRWAAVIAWGGLRGGLSMVLVLGLEPGFPHRELLVTMTYGVVVLSILIQGLTMTPLLGRLGLTGRRADRESYDKERGRLRTAHAALEALADMEKGGRIHSDIGQELREDYVSQAAAAQLRIRELRLKAAELHAEEQLAARRHLVQVEKQTLRADFVEGLLSPRAFEVLDSELDARLLAIENEEQEAWGAPTAENTGHARPDADQASVAGAVDASEDQRGGHDEASDDGASADGGDGSRAGAGD